MSKAAGQANVETFEKWRDAMLSNGFSEFKPLVNRGSLSRGKVSKASGVDLNALKELMVIPRYSERSMR